ncbi:hypothetical protein LCGC14_2898210 [marine sediment metagenome]|uniref:AP2/ERF domain-containing protein n=1 Tax=marine sediment metagenome TaxID=412755 RepID=A0A0F9A339_9ZZZZ
MNEIMKMGWVLRAIPDFPNYYVNDIGEVWSTMKSTRNPKGKQYQLKPNTNHKGYLFVILYRNKKRYPRLVARLIVDAPKNILVDHWNRIKTDNKVTNLRLCTHSQSAFNRKNSTNSESKFKGVHFDKKIDKWRATITKEGYRQHLGYFDDESEAAKVYNKKAIELHGEFACLNVI